MDCLAVSCLPQALKEWLVCSALVALLAAAPVSAGGALVGQVFSPHLDLHQRLLVLESLAAGARALARSGDPNPITSPTSPPRTITSPDPPVSAPGAATLLLGGADDAQDPGRSAGLGLFGAEAAAGGTSDRGRARDGGEREVGRSRRWGVRALARLQRPPARTHRNRCACGVLVWCDTTSVTLLEPSLLRELSLPHTALVF